VGSMPMNRQRAGGDATGNAQRVPLAKMCGHTTHILRTMRSIREYSLGHRLISGSAWNVDDPPFLCYIPIAQTSEVAFAMMCNSVIRQALKRKSESSLVAHLNYTLFRGRTVM
jgi:hypothetical protein